MSVRRAVYVALGANVGDPQAQIDSAIAALDALAGTRVVRRSHAYRSPAWGPIPQDDYVNAVIELETVLDPEALLAELFAIERHLGRDRSGPRYAPRRIDLDLLAHGDATVDAPGLRVPHPHLHERAFVLVPFAEIAPEYVVPGRGAVHDLLGRLDRAERDRVHRLDARVPAGE